MRKNSVPLIRRRPALFSSCLEGKSRGICVMLLSIFKRNISHTFPRLSRSVFESENVQKELLALKSIF